MGIFTKKKKVDAKVAEKPDIKSEKVEKTTKVDSGKDKKEVKKSMKELYSDDEKSKVKVVDDKKEVKTGKKKYGNAYKILVKPLITEKASDIGVMNKYVFEVAKDANKIEIAKAIEEVYGLMPKSVNTIRMKGKNVRHGKTLGKKKDWKKAIVTLEEGKSIKVYEGV